MFSTWIATIKEELFSFSKSERLFILFAMLSGALISAEYAIIRPVSNAVFLTAHGADFLPYAWMVAVPVNFLIVSLYNHYLPKWGCMRMFLTTTSTIIAFNIFGACCLNTLPALPFFFYVWKDIYIMLMFQQLWSVIHTTISFKKAKYLYGIVFATGALGAVIGSMVPGFLALRLGSETLLFASLPIYAILALTYSQVVKYSAIDKSPDQKPQATGFLAGFKLVFSSKLLIAILSIVCLMQLSSTLIDFQFNMHLEKAIVGKDLRTQYTAQILGIVHFATIALQLIGSFLCVYLLGIRKSHLFIPGLLLINALLFQSFPLFALISLSFICIKSFDFSLFTILKELLYIPLSQEEKFRAKAVIDVFAHRSAKAIGSLFILSLKLLAGYYLSIVGWLSVSLFILWMGIVFFWIKEQKTAPALKETLNNSCS